MVAFVHVLTAAVSAPRHSAQAHKKGGGNTSSTSSPPKQDATTAS